MSFRRKIGRARKRAANPPAPEIVTVDSSEYAAALEIPEFAQIIQNVQHGRCSKHAEPMLPARAHGFEIKDAELLICPLGDACDMMVLYVEHGAGGPFYLFRSMNQPDRMLFKVAALESPLGRMQFGKDDE